MLQENDHIGSTDRAWKQPEVEMPPGQPCDSRGRRPVEVKLQDRDFASQSPRSHAMRPFAQSDSVEKDCLAPDFGIYFSSGHRSRCPRRVFSSRSRPRRAGRCVIQPRARGTCQAWTMEYCTPHSRSMRCAMLQAVQRNVPYPRASGPRFKACSIRLRSAANSCGEHPMRSAHFRADFPPLTICFAQRFTNWRWTLTCRATSASLSPFFRSRMACIRRCSNLSRSDLTPAEYSMPRSYRNQTHLSLGYVVLSKEAPIRLGFLSLCVFLFAMPELAQTLPFPHITDGTIADATRWTAPINLTNTSWRTQVTRNSNSKTDGTAECFLIPSFGTNLQRCSDPAILIGLLRAQEGSLQERRDWGEFPDTFDFPRPFVCGFCGNLKLLG
jgi:hypothetical protein